MRVIATKPGYFGKLRDIGEEFDVPDDAKATWFTPAKGGKQAEKDDAKGGKQAEKGLV